MIFDLTKFAKNLDYKIERQIIEIKDLEKVIEHKRKDLSRLLKQKEWITERSEENDDNRSNANL